MINIGCVEANRSALELFSNYSKCKVRTWFVQPNHANSPFDDGKDDFYYDKCVAFYSNILTVYFKTLYFNSVIQFDKKIEERCHWRVQRSDSIRNRILSLEKVSRMKGKSVTGIQDVEYRLCHANAIEYHFKFESIRDAELQR